LITREVIYTDDVVAIFGPRPWTSRTEEILADRKAKNEADKQLPEAEKADDNNVDNDSSNVADVEATEVKDDGATPPPYDKA
jgi:cell division protease FtsH